MCSEEASVPSDSVTLGKDMAVAPRLGWRQGRASPTEPRGRRRPTCSEGVRRGQPTGGWRTTPSAHLTQQPSGWLEDGSESVLMRCSLISPFRNASVSKPREGSEGSTVFQQRILVFFSRLQSSLLLASLVQRGGNNSGLDNVLCQTCCLERLTGI